MIIWLGRESVELEALVEDTSTTECLARLLGEKGLDSSCMVSVVLATLEVGSWVVSEGVSSLRAVAALLVRADKVDLRLLFRIMSGRLLLDTPGAELASFTVLLT